MQAGIVMGNFVSALGTPNGIRSGTQTGVQDGDAALVAALKAGSEEAFGVLIAQYSQPIFTLIARSLQDPADAADITQEVFIKVFRSVGKFNGESSLRTWLYRIALHEASNQRRWWSRHKKQELTIDTPTGIGDDDGEEGLCLGATLADGQVSPYQQAEHGELKARVEDALRKLPEVFRTVVVLREMEGFSYDEIVEVVQVPAGTVKSRLMRGRAALKEILIAEGLVFDRHGRLMMGGSQ
jgi:RNA polymerase sigma-70 factor (ECF subfamily)